MVFRTCPPAEDEAGGPSSPNASSPRSVPKRKAAAAAMTGPDEKKGILLVIGGAFGAVCTVILAGLIVPVAASTSTCLLGS